MIERISRQLKERPANSIKELVLDNCPRCHSIEGLTDEFTSLTVLSMINVGLQSLDKFPKLPNLEKLYLSDNRLSNGLENLHGCPNLSVLILAGNKFKSIEQIQPLTTLTKLSLLDLANCPVTKEEKYREKIFEMFPQLKYLDNIDRDGVERDSDDDDEDEDDEEIDEENEEEEENENEPGLNALYNGTLEDDDDEDSYKGQSGDDEEDEEEDLSDDADESADPIQLSKGEKRKHVEENEENNQTKKI